MDGGKGLGITNGNVNFPYEIENVISIKKSIRVSGMYDDSYYYFYDWEVEAKHPCGTTEIIVEPTGSDTASQVDFKTDADTFFISQAFEIFFTDLSENPASWEWNFGNGIISNEQSPVASFDKTGTYQITLTVTDNNGCVNSKMKEIVVIADDRTSVKNTEFKNELTVFPNPANDLLYVNVPEGFSGSKGQVLVMDALGNLKIRTPFNSNENIYEVQINELEKAFQDCITNLSSQEYFTQNDSEETRQTVEQTMQHFLDTARRIEAFFLSQRLRLSVQKPEQLLKEEITELKSELERKEKLVEKHHERLQAWVNLFHSRSGAQHSSGTPSASQGTG